MTVSQKSRLRLKVDVIVTYSAAPVLLPVSTAKTPGSASARVVSMARMRAKGRGGRRSDADPPSSDAREPARYSAEEPRRLAPPHRAACAIAGRPGTGCWRAGGNGGCRNGARGDGRGGTRGSPLPALAVRRQRALRRGGGRSSALRRPCK